MRTAELKVIGGKLIRIRLLTGNRRIEKVEITGDFFLHPEETIDTLEMALRGQMLDADLGKSISDVLKENGSVLLGASPEDIAKCIEIASDSID